MELTHGAIWSWTLVCWRFWNYRLYFTSSNQSGQIMCFSLINFFGGLLFLETCMFLQFSHSVVSDSLQPHGLQHTKPPCLSPNSQSLLKLTSIELVMPSNHLILCCPRLHCQICCHIIVHSIPLWFFVFLQYQLLCLLFHLFGFSLISSWWAWPKICPFCLPFQRTRSWLCVFSPKKNLSFIYFLSDLYFFPSFCWL